MSDRETWARWGLRLSVIHDEMEQSAGATGPGKAENLVRYAIEECYAQRDSERDVADAESGTCRCGHSGLWHSHEGRGDCEYGADCDCKRFEVDSHERCVCGHLASWHADKGWGNCEHDGDCGCGLFEVAP